ncbi:hypothetical protein SAMN05421665_2308 [Yoonia rosea]|uniref:RHS repeat-associated core domain-containing protein n=1 Tax=Yoonia rosea TaxID=287098 RepID=A0A1R3X881_9RHOB|nr:hypothetical protein SAMN05421665_2308 [Yoonia rosea]
MQADPLGPVDGASVYGYALQNPGRYVDPTGEFIPILAGIALGAGLDLALQLWRNGGDINCVNWAEVGLGGALGAFGGGWARHGLRGARAMKWSEVTSAFKSSSGVSSGNISHHAIVRALKGHPPGWRNGWWNLTPMTRLNHNKLHNQFLRRGTRPFGRFGRWWHGTPRWLMGAEASAATGFAVEMADDGCGCRS